MRTALLVALLFLYLAIPRLQWTPARGLEVVRPSVLSGDEPHYMLVVNSILFDHDLRLEDDYRRVHEGGAQAGLAFRGNELDHHTILVDKRTGAHGLWQEVYNWRVHVRCNWPCVPFLKVQPGFDPGPDVIEVPAHPVGFPALLALLIAPFRPTLQNSESLAFTALAFLAWLAVLATYFAARRSGLTPNEALLAALLAGIASPLLAYARSMFAEGAAALALALAYWALVAERPALAGAACAAAAVMKPPYGLIALAWAALRWRQGRKREAFRILAAAAAGGTALVIFNYALARTPAISGTIGFLPAQGPEAIGVHFFSNAHGLFAFVPWAAAAMFALPAEMAIGALPVVLLFVSADLGPVGFCYGPRYFVPFIPWLAIATVPVWKRARPALRVGLAVLAVLSALIAVGGALRYREMWDRPSIAALRR
jgi:hypothetical protein